uniref:Uncharacterized protein n=1 Tax=Arundo donax TaxID=35708 RepID=A0A0A9F123_ARUDO
MAQALGGGVRLDSRGSSRFQLMNEDQWILARGWLGLQVQRRLQLDGDGFNSSPGAAVARLQGGASFHSTAAASTRVQVRQRVHLQARRRLSPQERWWQSL